MNNGILIVGGGLLQIAALKKAKELGYESYLTDMNEFCPAREHADNFYQINVNDFEGTALLAKKLKKENKISGVYTQGTDAEFTVAYAADEAGLFSIGSETARKCKNKVLMRKALLEYGVEDVKFSGAFSYQDCLQASKEVGYPLYIKPSDNSASRGITRVENDEMLENAFKEATSALLTESELILESEMIGSEHSVDCVMYKGILYPAGISDRVFLEKEVFAVQTESITPSLLSPETQKEMYKKMEASAKAIGIKDGAFKGDLLLDKKGNVRVIEVTARTSGGFDSQYRKPLSFGIDIIKATMDIALGKELDFNDLVPKYCMRSKTYSMMPEPGLITDIIGLEEARKIPGVHDIIVTKKVGDRIEEYKDCSLRTNFITIYAPTTAALENIQEKISKTLCIKTSN